MPWSRARVSTTERPYLIPVPTIETIFALTQLSAILPRLPVHTIGNAHDFRFALVAATRIPAATFMVGQIQALGIPFGNAEILTALIVIPADEVQGVFHVRATFEETIGLILILLPGLVLGLGIALRRGFAPEGNEQEPIPWRLRVMAKSRLLLDEGHENVGRRAPPVLGFFGRIVPLEVLSENRAQVVLALGWHGRATRQCNDHRQNTREYPSRNHGFAQHSYWPEAALI
jgi:hypothetical protein